MTMTHNDNDSQCSQETVVAGGLLACTYVGAWARGRVCLTRILLHPHEFGKGLHIASSSGYSDTVVSTVYSTVQQDSTVQRCRVVGTV